jgi:hypothetical protein
MNKMANVAIGVETCSGHVEAGGVRQFDAPGVALLSFLLPFPRVLGHRLPGIGGIGVCVYVGILNPAASTWSVTDFRS